MQNKSEIIEQFCVKYSVGINNLIKQNKLDDHIINDMKLFIEKNDTSTIENSYSLDHIYNYWFYLVNDFLKSKKVIQEIKSKKYICPGCLFYNKTTIVTGAGLLSCSMCSELYTKTIDYKCKDFYKKFAIHSSNGYRCLDCDRFIPSSNKNEDVVCPYLDCMFIGNVKDLKKMRHPSTDAEVLKHNHSFIETVQNNDINKIKDIITYQSNNLAFTKCNFTLNHKLFVYKAFEMLLDEFPTEMKDYLLGSRTGGFQHKIFQKYIFLLENSLPFTIKKNNKISVISNLLDSNLCLFDGISTFESYIVNGVIKNKTKEFYIGGRKASYAKPFYIGKILNILNLKNNQSINDNIIEYSFSKIKIKDIDNYTPVMVTHLRIPPHYQMGGMVYVNRIRKNIVDQLNNKEINV
jgi:hypothetical protein